MYHGFPEKPEDVPPQVVGELRARAEAEGHGAEFDAWMRGEALEVVGRDGD